MIISFLARTKVVAVGLYNHLVIRVVVDKNNVYNEIEKSGC